MLKVMILDDEAIARIGLVHSINWEENGFNIVGESGDRESARALALQKKPDIILVDIVLREENGLDFIEEIRSELPYTKFILVSCMNDPEYYRRAISLHVSSFIGKAEISPEELLEKLNQAAEEIYRERMFDPEEEDYEYHNRFLILDNYINRHLAMKEFDVERFEKRLKTNEIHVPRSGFAMICLRFDEEADRRKEALTDQLQILSREILAELSDGYVFWDHQKNLILLAFDAQAPLEEDLLQTICYRLTSTISEIFSLKATAGYSADNTGLDEFCSAWEEACEKSMPSSGVEHIHSGLKDATISKINQYIRDHLDDSVSLSQIAEAVHFSPTYVSRYYKKMTGINIKDFIADCRTERAKDLLAQGQNLNEIAEKLGFCSTSHFIHVFGAKTGMTPKEYLRSLEAPI